jgi:alkylation response protein AidB-like acyl-CoA dehydrogenase
MFDFDMGEDLDLVAETTRAFATETLLPRLREHEGERCVDASIRDTYAEMGLAGLELPESLGGAGLGTLARVIVNEELGAGDAGAAIALDPFGPALYALMEAGGESAVEQLAKPLLSGGGARAVLVDANDAQLEIGETVSGRVPWVPADSISLAVILSGDEVVVAKDGFAMSELRGSGLRAAGASELRFDASPIVARFGDAAGVARARARARLYTSSLLVGVMREAAEFSRRYAMEREAFGRPIAHHQGLAFLITDMHMAVDGARILLHEAAWRADRGFAFEAAAAAAFAEAVDASLLVGPNGVQILGGHGFMQDYPVEKYMREIRTLGLFHGGVDAARELAGREIASEPAGLSLSYIAGI